MDPRPSAERARGQAFQPSRSTGTSSPALRVSNSSTGDAERKAGLRVPRDICKVLIPLPFRADAFGLPWNVAATTWSCGCGTPKRLEILGLEAHAQQLELF